MLTTSVTQKGQITIPKEVRTYLGISPRNKVIFEKTKNGYQIKKAPDLLSLAGKGKALIRKNKKIDVVKAREWLETDYERV